jgi:hypothetical protein
MNLDNPKGTESRVSNDSKIRRTFLKHATAGAVIASIPGRSAWAGLAGSIVASGHGSDWNGGGCIKLHSHGWWKRTSKWSQVATDTTFASVFGSEPFATGGVYTRQDGDQSSFTLLEAILGNGGGGSGPLSQSIHSSGTYKIGGPGNVNTQMAMMYLNAAHGDIFGNTDVIYPIIGAPPRPFATLSAFGLYLGGSVTPLNAASIGQELDDIMQANSGSCI